MGLTQHALTCNCWIADHMHCATVTAIVISALMYSNILNLLNVLNVLIIFILINAMLLMRLTLLKYLVLLINQRY